MRHLQTESHISQRIFFCYSCSYYSFRFTYCDNKVPPSKSTLESYFKEYFINASPFKRLLSNKLPLPS